MTVEHTNQVLQTVVEDLERSYNNGTPIDPFILKSYNDDYSTLIPLINNILYSSNYRSIDPTGELLDFLPRILSRVPFNDILNIYPEELIFEVLENLTDGNNFQYVVLKVIQEKVNQIEFLEEILTLVISQYLTLENIPLNIVNQIELLIKYALNDGKVVRFESISTDSFTLKSRYLSYILILSEFKISIPSEVYTYTNDQILSFNEQDPLFTILLIQFYSDLFSLEVNEVNLEIVHILNNLNQLLHQNVEFITPEIANLFIKLSYQENYILVLSSALLKIEDLLDVEILVRLLSKLNPIVIYNVGVPLDEYSLQSNRYFPVLLNLVGSEELFKSNVHYFTTAKFAALTVDKSYALLYAISKNPYSLEYLFTAVPQVMNKFIAEEAVANPELFDLKLDIIRGLLSSEVESLQPWEEGLRGALRKLQFGDGVPRVAVVNRAG